VSVEALSVSKWFGQKVALSDVTVEFTPGVTGLLGPNGAGKTTLLRVLTGLQVPSQGAVKLLGVDPRRDRTIYTRVAMVPEDEAVYPDLTARSFLELKASLAGIRPAEPAVVRALGVVELTDAADRRMGEYSKGMKQRAKVAAALVSDPDVLVLDEPLNGADPVQRAQLIELFKRLGSAGKTVIVSSHVLAEVERMTHRVVAMVDGRLAATGDLEGLRAAMTDKPRQVHVVSSDARALARVLLAIESVAGVVIRGNEIELTTTDPRRLAMQLPPAARDAGVTVFEVAPADESMESVFRYLVEAAR
jgi:ABC-2 type transport system ATP-binding protein